MSRLNLSPEVESRLSEQQRSALARLQTWKLSGVTRRTQRRLGWSRSHRQTVEREYRRFLGLILLNPDREYGMAGDVDEVWHDHLLHTQDYFDMCRTVIGGFVHHCPGAPSERRSGGGGDAYEGATYPDLKRTYASRVSPVWPRAGDGDAVARCCGHSIEAFVR